MEIAIQNSTQNQQAKAASHFNAYAKKLGLYEKNIHEKYLGTIFTR
jgi:hypothetical protein